LTKVKGIRPSTISKTNEFTVRNRQKGRMINAFSGACGRARKDHLVHLARGVSSARKQYLWRHQFNTSCMFE